MKMKTCHIIRAFAGLLVWTANLLPVSSLAELTVAAPFTDNAVLQRDIPVPVWGKADAGATVTVELPAGRRPLLPTHRGTGRFCWSPLRQWLCRMS